MKKAWIALLLCLVVLLPLSAQAQSSPYEIRVNRAQNTVTVYIRAANGQYVPYKAMLCSTGRAGHLTPRGRYATTNVKRRWGYMFDGTYAQYTTQFNNNILFRSVCYSKADPSTLLTEEYTMLGSRASRGCVRLQVRYSKWIYDHCPAGTSVVVYDGDDPGPLGKPDPAVLHMTKDLPCRWDPTDPDPNNPWTSLLLPFDDLSYGTWYYESVAAVYEAGLMNGKSGRSFAPASVLTRAHMVQILYNMAGRPETETEAALPEDVLKTAWYAPAVRWYTAAFSEYNGAEISGKDGCFAPDEPAGRGFLVSSLYQMMQKDGAAAGASKRSFTDEKQMTPFEREAVYCLTELGIIRGYSDGSFRPDAGLTRAAAAAILARFVQNV